MKHTLIVALFCAFTFAACSSDKQQENTQELEAIETEMDELSDEIESETEDMKHDVDSLLEGI